MTDSHERTWHEILRSVPAVALTTEGTTLSGTELLETGLEVAIVEERGTQLLVESRGSTPGTHWQYLLDRGDFETAISPPQGLPREGESATAPVSSTGSPD